MKGQKSQVSHRYPPPLPSLREALRAARLAIEQRRSLVRLHRSSPPSGHCIVVSTQGSDRSWAKRPGTQVATGLDHGMPRFQPQGGPPAETAVTPSGQISMHSSHFQPPHPSCKKDRQSPKLRSCQLQLPMRPASVLFGLVVAVVVVMRPSVLPIRHTQCQSAGNHPCGRCSPGRSRQHPKAY